MQAKLFLLVRAFYAQMALDVSSLFVHAFAVKPALACKSSLAVLVLLATLRLLRFAGFLFGFWACWHFRFLTLKLIKFMLA